MGLIIIEYVYASIVLFGVATLILDVGSESSHVGQVGLSLLDHLAVHQTALIAFNFSCLNAFCYVIFSENIDFYECIRRLSESLL